MVVKRRAEAVDGTRSNTEEEEEEEVEDVEAEVAAMRARRTEDVVDGVLRAAATRDGIVRRSGPAGEAIVNEWCGVMVSRWKWRGEIRDQNRG